MVRSAARRHWVLFLALAISAIAWADASYLTGTRFPFESCVQNTKYSPYYATLYSYKENTAKKTSQYCIQIHVAPSCTPGSYRCCNTSINKVKFFPALGCRGSLASANIRNSLININVTSIYWE
ncbi:hypothetical protein Agub_g12816, partial [Astrephomene gubernaculifera]